MTDVFSILRSYVTDSPATRAEAVRVRTQEAAAQKRATLAAQGVGTGPQETPEQYNARLNREYTNRADNRTNLQLGADTAVRLARGAVGSVIGAAGLGASIGTAPTRMLNEAMGGPSAAAVDPNIVISGWAKGIHDFMGKGLSQDANLMDEQLAAENAVTSAENKALADAEIADGANPFLAGSARIARDFGNTIENNLSNPGAMGGGVNEAAGSLLVGGPVAKTITAGSELALAGAAARGYMSTRAANYAASAIKNGAMTSVIVGMEAGSASQDTINQVMGMNHDQLMAGSDMYNQLITEYGDTPAGRATARREVAATAGTMAATVQAPLAALAGKMVSKFELNPLANQTVKASLHDIGMQTLEEGFQEATGNLSGNIGTRLIADRNGDLLQGVGEGAAAGALYGAGMTAGVAAPSVLTSSVINSGTAAMATIGELAGAAGQFANYITNRGQEMRAKHQERNNATMTDNIKDAQNITPEDAVQAEQAVAAAESTAPDIRGAVDAVFSAVRFKPEELQEAPESVKTAIGQPETLIDGVQALSNRILNQESSEQEKAELGLYMIQTLTRNRDLLETYMPNIMSVMEEGNPALERMRAMQASVSDTLAHPKIQSAIKAGMTAAMAQAVPENLTVDKLETPEGKIAVEATKYAAQNTPDQVNPESAELVMRHATSGKIDLPESMKRLLAGSISLVKSFNEAAKQRADLGLNTSAIDVSVEAQGRQGMGSKGLSAREHSNRVITAMANGDLDTARESLARLKDFAQHLSNKTAAVNRSYSDFRPGQDAKVKFQAVTPTGEWYESSHYVNRTSAATIATAQQIGVDAKMVTQAYNGLVAAFPELDGRHLLATPLTPDLVRAEAKQLAEDNNTAYRNERASKSVQKDAPSTVTVQNETPATVENTVVDETPVEAEVVVEQEPTKEAEPEAEAKPDTEVSAEKSVSDQVEAQPEPEIETESSAETESVVEETPKTVEELFPNLIEDQTGNKLLSNFEVRKNQTSRIIGLTNAMQAVKKALTSITEFDKFTGKPNRKLTVDVATAYGDLLGDANAVAKEMTDRVEVLFNRDRTKKLKDGTTSTKGPVSSLLSDISERPLNWSSFRAANLLEENGRGGFKYNGELLAQGVLAGFNWLVDSQARQIDMDSEQLAKALSIPEAAITTRMQIEFNKGVFADTALQGLGRSIERFWGIEPKGDTPIGQSYGVTQAFAAEIIMGMVEAGLVTITTETIQYVDNYGDEKIKSFDRILYNRNALPGQSETEVSPLFQFPDAIAQAALTEFEPTGPFFNEEPPATRAQLRNSAVELTDEQLEVQKKQGAITFNFVPHILNAFKSLDMVGMVNVFGEGDLSTRKLNESHKKTLEGRNLSITAAMQQMYTNEANAQTIADEDGSGIEEVGIHYGVEFIRMNRAMRSGAHNPQSSKLMRAVLSPNTNILDLSDPQKMLGWSIGLAQHMGVKVHKKITAEIIGDLNKKLDAEPMRKALEGMMNWLEDQSAPIDEDLQSDIKDAFGGKPSFEGFVALLDYARYLNADAEGRKAFTTTNYVEADGITDGPANAMWHLSIGPFNERWLNNMERTGMYVTGEAKSYNDYFTSPGAADLYEATTGTYKGNMAQLQQKLKRERSPALSNFKDILYLLEELLPNQLSYKDGVLTFDRGVVKNPMTITVYGSSAQGIGANVAKELTDALYERMSDAMQRMDDNGITLEQALFYSSTVTPQESAKKYARFDAALTRLTNSIAVESKGKHVVIGKELKGKDKDFGSAEKFKLSGAAMANLSTNMTTLFVQPLRDAIGEELGSAMAGADLVQRTTGAMAAYARGLFNALNEQTLKAKKAAGTADLSDFLTPNELKANLRKMQHVAPFIRTDTMNFLIGGQDDVRHNRSIAAAMSDDLRSKITTKGYALAGVSGNPYTVIGFGDGQMMQNAALDLDNGNLLVYDGANLSINDVFNDNVKVNKAGYDAWFQNNLLDSVNTTYENFMKDVNIDLLSQEDLEPIYHSLMGKKPDGLVNKTGLKSLLAGAQISLKSASEESRARQAVMKRLNMSVDHMAGTQSPYVAEGDDLINLGEMTNAEKVPFMVAMYNEELGKIREEDTNNQDITDVTWELYAEMDRDPSGVSVIESRNLLSLVQNTRIPANQRALAQGSIQALAGAGYKVVYGTRANLAKYSKANGLGDSTLLSPNDMGLTSIKDRVILIATGSTETLVHELIHAATMETVQAVYNDPQSVHPETRAAVERLEALMNEWLEMGPDIQMLRGAEANRAYRDAVNAIRSMKNNPAAALNEFMAWNLTNQELIRVTSAVKVINPLARIAKAALTLIKQLIWPNGNGPRVGSDMFSNIQFNSKIVMAASVPTVSQDIMNIRALRHSTGNVQSDRLDTLSQQFERKLNEIADNMKNPVERTKQGAITNSKAFLRAISVTGAVEAIAFPFTDQERGVFTRMLAAFVADAQMDPQALRGLARVQQEVLTKLKVEDLMADPEMNDPTDRQIAQNQYDVLTNQYDFGNDMKGRSMNLPVFAALGAVHEGLRDKLSKITLSTPEKGKTGTVDTFFNSYASEALGRLTDATAGITQNAKATDVIETLMDTVALSVEKDRNTVSKVLDKAADLTDLANSTLTKGISVGVDAGIKTLEKITNQAKGTKYETQAKMINGIGAAIMASISKDRAEDVASGFMDTVNTTKMPKMFSDVFAEIVGATTENADVLQLVKYVRTMIQQTRQHYREQLPQILAAKFKTKPTTGQWKAMFNGMGKSDLAAFAATKTATEIMNMVSNETQLKAEIIVLEEALQKQAGSLTKLYKTKMEELAQFMSNGTKSANLLRNAEMIANLYGETAQATVSDELIQTIDQLTSLYALRLVPEEQRTAMAELAQNEVEGMEYVMSYLIGQRKDELAKPASISKLNHWKGYVPVENKGRLVVVGLKDVTHFEELGFTKVGNYDPSGADLDQSSRVYMYSSEGRPGFNQGIMQNVRPTVSGLDETQGYSLDGFSAGTIYEPAMVAKITARIAANGRGEALLPLYREDGSVFGYERTMDTSLVQSKLSGDRNLALSLGIWRGRQVEEVMANNSNFQLLKVLDKMYKDRHKNNTPMDAYIDLMATTDPVYKDALQMLSPTIKAYIKNNMGGVLMIRKDMIDNSIGYRSASIGDMWTGNSRIGEKHQEQMKNVLTSVFGPEAYSRLTKAEKSWQGLMSDARVMIVVKSVIVPMANLMSNTYQLMSRGVPLHVIAAQMPKKVAEVSEFLRNDKQRRKLEADLAVATSNKALAEINKLETQIKLIKDSNRRLTIWPLLQAGELSSLSEGLSSDDLNFTKGRLWDYLGRQADKLPAPIKTAGRYALVTKDTALFNGLTKATAYGDFLAKAILYDHLSKKESDPKKILLQVSNEFINYDLLPGRTRSYLEKSGLIWFWNFKIRAIKIAVNSVRENPLHLLLTSLVPAPSSVDLPHSANLASVIMDGRLGASIGAEEALRALHMNPLQTMVF